MRADNSGNHASTLRDYLNVVRRRKWIILQAIILVPLAAVVFSLQQQKKFESSAQVLLSRQNLANSLTGTQDPTQFVQADRLAQTQADVARVPTILSRVLHRLDIRDRSVGDLLANSSVDARQNADLLDFKVVDPDPTLASQLATEYAREFTIYRRQLDTASLQRARSSVQKRIDELELANATKGALYASLIERDQQLATMEALQTSNAFVVQDATGASQVQPKPVRNGVLGLMLGLVLGLGLAYAYVAYRIGDGPEAEDVTSETFERALRYRKSFDSRRGDPVAWLIGIARRCIADAVLPRPIPIAEVPESAALGELEGEALQRLELAGALATLEERERELLALRYGGDLTARQIGELLEMKTNAVEVALHRALARLRAQLIGGHARTGRTFLQQAAEA